MRSPRCLSVMSTALHFTQSQDSTHFALSSLHRSTDGQSDRPPIYSSYGMHPKTRLQNADRHRVGEPLTPPYRGRDSCHARKPGTRPGKGGPFNRRKRRTQGKADDSSTRVFIPCGAFYRPQRSHYQRAPWIHRIRSPRSSRSPGHPSQPETAASPGGKDSLFMRDLQPQGASSTQRYYHRHPPTAPRSSRLPDPGGSPMRSRRHVRLPFRDGARSLS